MNDADLKALLPEIVALARAAGEVVMKIYAGDFDVRAKADASPVTVADEESEKLILAGLAKLTPHIPAASEEQVSHAGSWKTPPGMFWLVDPLDGTREFASRNGEFSVNIGLVDGGRPILGAVHGPTSDVTWGAAGPGTAAVWRGNAAPKPIRARRTPPDGAIVLESRSHGDRAALDAFLGEHKIAGRKQSGSALKFGLLAEGEADLYPRFGPTMEWDTAAGQAILEAAGGSIVTLEGERLAYGKPGYRNSGFIARGRTS